MASTKRILFLTNSEFGEANVVIATAFELLQFPNSAVHIASYSPLLPRVTELQNGDFGTFSPSSSLTFHQLPGLSMHETRAKKFNIPNIKHAPTVRDAVRMYGLLQTLSGTRTGEEWVEGCRACEQIIQDVKPDVVVVDSYFHQGIDACRQLALTNYMILSPVTFREVTSDQESFIKHMYKYPAKGSGYPFPLRKRQIPANVYLNIRLISKFIISNPALTSIQSARKSAGMTHKIPALDPYLKSVTYILPSTPESDFPIRIPSNFICCGPIFVPSRPLSIIDPELNQWLTSAPTVLINLGSFLAPGGSYINAIAGAIELLFKATPDIHVLWKLPHYSDAASLSPRASTLLTPYLSTTTSAPRLKILPWLPTSILTPHSPAPPSPSPPPPTGLILSIHHGGANSYFETLAAGLPHIVLPCWHDTYEFAARVEYLGIGVYGSKVSKTAPEADAQELGAWMVRFCKEGGTGEPEMRKKATELAGTCSAYGGRRRAAEVIMGGGGGEGKSEEK